jgi:3D (Asp-Asp-Asp) domain-containing protein
MFKQDIKYESSTVQERKRAVVLTSRWIIHVLLEAFVILTLSTSVYAQQDKPAQEPQKNADNPANTDISASLPIIYTKPRLSPRRLTAFPRRGIISADPRVLPSGSMVHLDAGKYTGTYFVLSACEDATINRPIRKGAIDADSKVWPLGTRRGFVGGAYYSQYPLETRMGSVERTGTMRGREINIWVPSSTEAMRFGRRNIRLSVISYGAKKNPVYLRDELEKKYINKVITENEYKIKDQELSKYEDRVYSTAAKYLSESKAVFQNAVYSPNKVKEDSPHQKDLTDTMYERIHMEFDLARKLISNDEYEYRKQQTIMLEKEIARENNYSPLDIAVYYEKVTLFPKQVELLAQSKDNRHSIVERFIPWAMPSAVLIGTFLTFFISFRKDRREKEAFKFQKKEMELKELQAQETIEKTNLLLRTKELQVEEMRLKVAQLEQQILPNLWC